MAHTESSMWCTIKKEIPTAQIRLLTTSIFPREANMVAILKRRPLGSQGLLVSPQGLTCMGTENRANLIGGEEVFSRKDQENRSVKTIQNFIELGLNFFDTAWTCESNCILSRSAGTKSLCRDTTSEFILGYAMGQLGRRKFVVATRFYMESVDLGLKNLAQTFPQITQMPASRGLPSTHSDDNFATSGQKYTIDRIIRSQLAASLKRLGTDYIDLYYLQRTDLEETVIEEVMFCLRALVRERKIKYIGLSVNSAAIIRMAHKIHPLTAIFVEYSFQYRDIEQEALITARELGIGIVARNPYGQGPSSSDQPVWRGSNPRGSPGRKIKQSNSQFLDLATEKNCTPNQLALGWLHAQGVDIFPLIETNSTSKVTEAFQALKIHLYGSDVEEIGTIRF